MDLIKIPFSDFNLQDSFFDSLRASYVGFDDWFRKKASAGEKAIAYFDDGVLLDFLYLKIENEEMEDVMPPLPVKRRLKIGTFKIESRGTRRGERFMKKLFDVAIANDVDEIYATIFPDERLLPLIRAFEKFGFEYKAIKKHSNGKVENVYVRDMKKMTGNVFSDYPFVTLGDSRYFLLGIYPDFHTKLFPDSILKNEVKYDIIKDTSITNSIYKNYITRMRNTDMLRPGDKIVIYRTSDNLGPAKYRSVCTSVCTVTEVRLYTDFQDINDFVKYTRPRSIFSKQVLTDYYKRHKDLVVIQMVYNIAFTKKVILNDLRENVKLNTNYWGFCSLRAEQFNKILALGEVDERYLIP